jgi:hypothetical protein
LELLYYKSTILQVLADIKNLLEVLIISMLRSNDDESRTILAQSAYSVQAPLPK